MWYTIPTRWPPARPERTHEEEADGEDRAGPLVRAAVCRAFGEPLTIEDLTLAPPQGTEVRVAIKACAICHSDVLSMQGAWGGVLPAVFGHEAAGVVAEVGPHVTGLEPGDHVVVTLIRSCGRCVFCVSGQPVFCESTFRLDAEGPLSDRDGAPVRQALRTGAFAEEVVVEAAQVVSIPKDIPFDAASLLACGVITGAGAVTNTAGVEAGSSVVVIGTGGVGLNTVQGAAIAGAREIVAIDLADEKLAAAASFGATRTVNSLRDDAAEAVAEATEGRGADYVFVTVGVKAAIDQGLGLMRRGGTTVIVGMPPSGVMTEFEPVNLADGGQRIMGSKMGAARIQVDIPNLLVLYRQGRLKLDELITGRFTLDEINDAVDRSQRGDTLRNVVLF
jgi:S-(hydroxymethyl)glutathione dehydrogenase / alcohol dehydrogenase